MKTEERSRHTVWMEDTVWQRVQEHYKRDGCSTQNEFKPQTARFGTTLFLDNPLHRQAWEILSAIPAGQRTNWLCLALCQQAQREQFLKDLKAILQTELQNSSDLQAISQPQPAGSVDDDVLGFLRALQEEGEES